MCRWYSEKDVSEGNYISVTPVWQAVYSHSTLPSYPAKAKLNSPLWYIIQYLLFMNSSLLWEWNKIISENVCLLLWMRIVPFTLPKKKKNQKLFLCQYSLPWLTHFAMMRSWSLLVIIRGYRLPDKLMACNRLRLPHVSALPNLRHFQIFDLDAIWITETVEGH